MDSISPIVQKEKSRKKLVEQQRNNAFITAVEDIKKELIQRGFGKEEDLGSQPAVLMLVAETLNQVDLKSKKNPVEPRRKCKGGKMPRDMEKVVKATREQMRRNKKNAAIESLREFINRKKLGDGPSNRLEQLKVVEIILEHIRTLPLNSIVTPTSVQQPYGQVLVAPIAPTSPSFTQPRQATVAFNIATLLQKKTTPPQSPSLPTLVPTPPLAQQNPVTSPVGTPSPGLPDVPAGPLPPLPLQFNFPWPATLFPMIPLTDSARIQMQLQSMRNQIMLQNLMKATQTKKEESI